MPEPVIDSGWEKLYAGELLEAQAVFDQVLVANPHSVGAMQGKIAALRRQQKYEEAHAWIEEAFSRLGDAGRRLVGIWDELGWLYSEQGKYQQAIGAFEKALALSGADPGAHYGTVSALHLLRRYGAMVEAAEAALTELPPDEIGTRAAIWNELGWARRELGQFEAARQAFAETLTINPEDADALYGTISALRMAGSFADAHEVVNELFRSLKDPGALVGVACELGWLRFGENDYEQAVNTFDGVLSEEPYYESALQGKAASLRMLHRFDEARDVIEEALSAHAGAGCPKGRAWGSGLQSELGWLHFSQGKFLEAERAIARALAQKPDRIEFNFGRVEALLRLKRFFEANQILRGLCEKYPQDPSVQNQLGRFLTRRNRLVEAEELFEAILQQHPESVDALIGLGAVRFKQGEYEEARKSFEHAVELRPRSSQIRTNLAWALLHEGSRGKQSVKRLGFSRDEPSRLAEAEEHARRALELHPTSGERAGAFGCLGVLAYHRGQILEARDYLRESVRSDRQSGDHVDLGALCTEMGHFEEAGQHLKTALEVDRDHVQAHVELGNLYLQTEQYGDAESAFRHAVGLNPEHMEAQRGLAIALMELDRYEEAEKTLRFAMLEGDIEERAYWRLYLTLSQVLSERASRQNDPFLYKEALAEVQRAFGLMPKHPDLYFQSAVLRFKLDDHNGALRHFRNCAREDKRQFLAELYARKVEALLRNEAANQRATRFGGLFLMAMSSLVLLTLLFVRFAQVPWAWLGGDPVDDGVLAALIPVLLGFIVIGFVLPGLIRFRLPGLEAELSQPEPKAAKETIILGPKADNRLRSSIAMGGSGYLFWY